MRKLAGRSLALAAAISLATLGWAAAGTAATPAAASTHTANTHAKPALQRQVRRRSVLDQLDLTDTQRASVKQLSRTSMQQERPLLQALRQKQAVFANATPGTADYQSATDALATAEANAAHKHVLDEAAFRAGVYKLLTPTQRTKLASLQAERMAKLEQWRKQHAAPAASGK